MDKDYNKEKHRQLLKYSEDLRKQGKFIAKESREDYLKLLSYSAMVSSQLNWEIQDQYLEIFKKFLSNRITSVKFCEILEEKLELNEELSNSSNSSRYSVCSACNLLNMVLLIFPAKWYSFNQYASSDAYASIASVIISLVNFLTMING
jgi:hypothetical protein